MRNVQVDTPEGPELLVAGAVASQHRCLQGPVPIMGKAETLTQSIEQDSGVG